METYSRPLLLNASLMSLMSDDIAYMLTR
jgi:hypothetical protein